MSNYQNAIDELLKFKDVFDGIDPRVPNKLLYAVGEFYVLKELEERGFNDIEHKGGQSGCDIRVNNGKRIEVKTSRLKNDSGPKDIFYYGWKVQNKNQKNTDKFDTMVCVGLDNDFRNPKFYIFTNKEAFSVGETNHKRYTRIAKRILLFENEAAYEKALTSYPDIIVDDFEKYINEHPLEFKDKWDKI